MPNKLLFFKHLRIHDELFNDIGVSRKLSEANVKKILQLLPKSHEDEKYGWEFSQIDPYYQPKAVCGISDINLDDIDIMSLDPDCTCQSKILIIYTGGTIGMRLKKDGYQPECNYFCKALRKLPMFHDSNVR